MKHRGHKVRDVSTEYTEGFDEPLRIVMILLGLCQQPHAHSPRLTLPFTYSVSIHKQALVYCNVSVAANKNCRERKLAGSVLTRKWYISLQWDLSQCVWRPGGERTSWMSIIHTFTTLGSFQLEAGVVPGQVEGQKTRIVAVILPFLMGCRAHNATWQWASHFKHLENTAAHLEKCFDQCCRPVQLFESTDSSLNVFAHSIL